jgi:protein involved in polysaccharide export with SLBB domain
LLAALLGACTASAPHLSPGVVTAGGTPLAPEHTLTAGDVFEIRFPFAPEFNDKVTVGDDGTVAPKLIGRVAVGGLTAPEATARLKARYAEQVHNPELSLTVRAYAPEVFWVEGAVAHPGVIRSELPLTLGRAVTQAGGLKPGAESGDILIIRRDDSGHSVRAYRAPLRSAPGTTEPLLKSFDVVYVPQSPMGSINEFMAQYAKSLPFAATLEIVPTTVPIPVLTAPQVVPRLR